VLAVLAVLAVAGTAVGLLIRPDEHGPDPYKGAYPLISPTPTPTAVVWTPSGPPAGPLRRFRGRPSKVIGRVIDHQSGLSYARLGAPWRLITGVGGHTGGVEYTVEKPKFEWFGTVGSRLLDAEAAPAATGPSRLRAAAELGAQRWGDGLGVSKLTPIAGQPMKVSGRQAWLAGYRGAVDSPVTAVTERIFVVVAVDTGRPVPGLLELSLGKPKYALLPDFNTAVSSLRVIR
jgi:hypothetical protein